MSNLGYTLFPTLGAGLALLPVGPLAAMGMGMSLVRNRRRPVFLVLLAVLSFLLVMSLTHWERRYFFFILVCYSGFAAFGVFEIARWIGRALGSMMAAHATMAVLVLWIVVPSIVTVWQAAAKTLSRQPVELLPAAEVVRREASPGATVMAVRAQMAYLDRNFRALAEDRRWRSSAQTMLDSGRIPYTDMTPCLSRLSPAERFPADGRNHFAPAGNAAVAACLRDTVRALLLQASAPAAPAGRP